MQLPLAVTVADKYLNALIFTACCASATLLGQQHPARILLTSPCLMTHRFQGHGDVITGIGYLQALDCYVTSSWDKSLRLWRRPTEQTVPAAVAGGRAASVSAADVLLGEDSEDVAGSNVSEYEKVHPLVMPKSLGQVCE